MRRKYKTIMETILGMLYLAGFSQALRIIAGHVDPKLLKDGAKLVLSGENSSSVGSKLALISADINKSTPVVSPLPDAHPIALIGYLIHGVQFVYCNTVPPIVRGPVGKILSLPTNVLVAPFRFIYNRREKAILIAKHKNMMLASLILSCLPPLLAFILVMICVYTVSRSQMNTTTGEIISSEYICVHFGFTIIELPFHSIILLLVKISYYLMVQFIVDLILSSTLFRTILLNLV